MEAGMNWKDHAHLFANGEFKVQIHYGVDKKPILQFNHRTLPDVINYPKHCTLIARKIEGITEDEELRLINKSGEYLVKVSGGGFTSFGYDGFLYLLSIGVYPFSQDDFENETVIDINTL